MSSEEQLKELSTVEYWDKYYRDYPISGDGGPAQQSKTSERDYEWYRTFEDVKPFLVQHLPPPLDSRVLHLGNGTSTIPHDLWQLGYTSQICVDFSSIAIEKMRTKFADAVGLHWLVTDVRNMPDIETCSINAAIDKGTLDAMLNGPVLTPPPEVEQNVKQYVDEVLRVLAPGGKFLYITYKQPHSQKPLLVRENVWT